MITFIPINLYQWLDLGLKSVIAIFAAGLTGTIAYNQYRVAKDKLRFDLFEKRFAVYNFFHNKWEDTIFQRKLHELVPLSEKEERNRIVRESAFLFGDDIFEYLRSFNDQIYEYVHAQVSFNIASKENGVDREKRIALYDDAENKRKALAKEIEVLIEKMKPYLSLTHRM